MTELDETLCPLDGELSDGRVVLRRTVEGGGDDLTLHCALHVRDLFRTLIDENDHEVDLWVVLRDGVGDGLEHEGLARLRRRDDEPALALADRRHEVDDAGGELLRLRLEAQALRGVERGQLAELDAVGGLVDRQPVDRVDLDDRVVLLATAVVIVARLADGADDGVALAQVVLLDLAEGHVDIVVAREISAGAHESVVVEHVEDAGDRDEHVILGDFGLEVVVAAWPTTLAVAVAVAAAAVTVLVLEISVLHSLTVVVLVAIVCRALVAVVLVAPVRIAVVAGRVALLVGILVLGATLRVAVGVLVGSALLAVAATVAVAIAGVARRRGAVGLGLLLCVLAGDAVESVGRLRVGPGFALCLLARDEVDAALGPVAVLDHCVLHVLDDRLGLRSRSVDDGRRGCAGVDDGGAGATRRALPGDDRRGGDNQGVRSVLRWRLLRGRVLR